MVDLDRQALQIAQRLVQRLVDKIPAGDNKKIKEKIEELENQLAKGLGILTESGVYALFVYLLAKRKKDKNGRVLPDDPCHVILEGFFDSLRDGSNAALRAALGFKKDKLPKDDKNPSEVLEWALGQVNDLSRLLLLRDFLLRVFTYGRYVAAARKTELKAGSSGGGGANS